MASQDVSDIFPRTLLRLFKLANSKKAVYVYSLYINISTQDRRGYLGSFCAAEAGRHVCRHCHQKLVEVHSTAAVRVHGAKYFCQFFWFDWFLMCGHRDIVNCLSESTKQTKTKSVFSTYVLQTNSRSSISPPPSKSSPSNISLN
jgi:hypothetical protein